MALTEIAKEEIEAEVLREVNATMAYNLSYYGEPTFLTDRQWHELMGRLRRHLSDWPPYVKVATDFAVVLHGRK